MTRLQPLRSDEPIAVTVCTKNRPAYLASLLGSLVNQSYGNWMLVVNDQSAPPAVDEPAVADLLDLMRTKDHEVVYFRTSEPRDRYQRAMEAVPSGIDVLVRVDDDNLLAPDYLENLHKAFLYLPELPVAAVGGCYPGARSRPLSLPLRLADPDWVPRVDRPTWRLQGHAYLERLILEVESLWGTSMAYRRTAVQSVGGWVVPGQSEQIFREDSDMSARLLAAGHVLLVSTAARGWHLVAPKGGSREYLKTPEGNVIVSSRAPFKADDRLFRQRMAAIGAAGLHREDRKCYRIADLERGKADPSPMVTPWRRRLRGMHKRAQGLRSRLRRMVRRSTA